MRADYSHNYHPADTTKAAIFGLLAMLGAAAVLVFGLSGSAF